MNPMRYPVTFGAVVTTLAIAILVIVQACAPRPPPVIVVPEIRQDPSLVTIDASAPAPPAHPPTIRLRARGTNLSGGEFAPTKIPGVYGTDYLYPSASDVDFFVARGMNHFRIGFLHERIQKALKGPLDEAEWTRLLTLVTYARSKGATVAIVPHNGARFAGKLLTEAEFGDFWGRVAGRLKDTSGIALNLTNEPHDVATEQWVALANAALREIRRVGFKGVVQVPGNGWTGASHWAETWYGTPNAKAMLDVVDPGANMVFEVHQYLDSDASGAGKECISATIGVERLAPFTSWLRANGRLGALGELGAPNTPTCKLAVAKMLESLESDYDVWTSWAWWSAGVWSFSGSGSYPLSIGPSKPGETERPQLGWLLPFTACPRPAL